MEEYTDQLKGEVADYTTFIRQSGSEQSFVDLYYTAKALPSDVVARLDSVKTGEVFGPYYNSSDNTLNSFKKLEVVNMADSIQFRQIQVTGETQARAQQLLSWLRSMVRQVSLFGLLQLTTKALRWMVTICVISTLSPHCHRTS